jgi:hypothetical protein
MEKEQLVVAKAIGQMNADDGKESKMLGELKGILPVTTSDTDILSFLTIEKMSQMYSGDESLHRKKFCPHYLSQNAGRFMRS